ncbi:MAG: hypothetical protein ACI8P5_002066, partial [Bacteroidia bacterium]
VDDIKVAKSLSSDCDAIERLLALIVKERSTKEPVH